MITWRRRGLSHLLNWFDNYLAPLGVHLLLVHQLVEHGDHEVRISILTELDMFVGQARVTRGGAFLCRFQHFLQDFLRNLQHYTFIKVIEVNVRYLAVFGVPMHSWGAFGEVLGVVFMPKCKGLFVVAHYVGFDALHGLLILVVCPDFAFAAQMAHQRVVLVFLHGLVNLVVPVRRFTLDPELPRLLQLLLLLHFVLVLV